MAPSFRVSLVFCSSFDRQFVRSLALVLSPSRSCTLAIDAPWFTVAPVQYTWQAALWTSPRPSTAVWLGHSLLSTETARGRVMQDGEPGSSEEHALFTLMVPCASRCTLSTVGRSRNFGLGVSARPFAHLCWDYSTVTVMGCIYPSASANKN